MHTIQALYMVRGSTVSVEEVLLWTPRWWLKALNWILSAHSLSALV
jgi:hypothetical protein